MNWWERFKVWAGAEPAVAIVDEPDIRVVTMADPPPDPAPPAVAVHVPKTASPPNQSRWHH
jgi:hypothetical protein